MVINNKYLRIYIFCILLLFVLQLFLINGITLLTNNPQAIDFLAFYTGGTIAATRPDNLYDLTYQQAIQQEIAPIIVSKNIFLPFLNPPFVAAFFGLFSYLPVTLTYALWTALNVLITFLICYISIKILKNTSTIVKVFFVIGIFLFIPLLTSLLIGQLSFVVCIVVLCCWLLLMHKKYFWGGLILSLLLIKPHFILLPFFVFIIQRQYKVILGMISGILTLSVFSYLSVGIEGIKDYIELLTIASSWNSGYGIDIMAQHSLQTVLLILTGNNSLSDIRVLWFICISLLSILTVIIWTKKYAYDSAMFALQFALLILSVLLISPHTHFHDLMLLIIVALQIIYATINNPKLYKTKIAYAVIVGYAVILSGYVVELYFVTSSRPAWILTTVLFMLSLWSMLFYYILFPKKIKNTKQ